MARKGFTFTQVVIGIIAVVVIVGIIFVSHRGPVWRETVGEHPASTDLKTFTSWRDVQLFLTSSTYERRNYYGPIEVATSAQVGAPASRTAAADSATPTTDFSTTNIQVEGVDEADILKNDGKYIYTITGGKIAILEAYPAAEMKLLTTINDSTTTFSNIFIAGDKLVAFGSDQFDWGPIVIAEQTRLGIEPQQDSGSSGAGEIQTDRAGIAIAPSPGVVRPEIYPYPYYGSSSVVKVYDISDRSAPQLLKTINYKGNYVSSRLIGSKVYLITAEPVYYGLPRPLYAVDGDVRAMQPQEITYFDYPFDSYQFTTVLGIDLNNLQGEEQRKVVLMGGSQTIFVSLDNAYITFTKYNYFQPVWPAYEKVVLLEMSEEFREKIYAIDSADTPQWRKENLNVQVAKDYLSTLNDSQQQQDLYQQIYQEQEMLARNYTPTETTSIHKFSLSSAFALGNAIVYEGEGSVPGHILNQFSMDEKDGLLRIATTTGQLSRDASQPSTTNNLYVLSTWHGIESGGGLSVVGKIEGLAPGESIYSARFLGNRAYLVTFKKVDPLFVIDLSEPTNPQLLGKLKIPGYSDYLHPYDENHLIGLGKDAVPSEQGDFAWYHGVKLTMFDVSNVSNPVELATYKIGDRGTESAALHDHHAFLFSRSRNLLVLPIRLAEIDESQYPSGVEPNAYGTFTFQGAYVFNVQVSPASAPTDPSATNNTGFVLRGRISHASQEDLSKLGDYYYGYGTDVERSAYIGETLYTISQKWVKANSLQTLAEEGTVQLPFVEQQNPYEYGIPI